MKEATRKKIKKGKHKTMLNLTILNVVFCVKQNTFEASRNGLRQVAVV